MKQDELIKQEARFRKMFKCRVLSVILFSGVAIVIYGALVSPVSIRYGSSLHGALLGLPVVLVWFGALLAILWIHNRGLRTHGLVCPSCRKPLIEPRRKAVFEAGKCPCCGARVLEHVQECDTNGS